MGHIDQLHLIGTEDEIVSVNVAESFVNALPPGSWVHIVQTEGFDHQCCWIEHWPNLLHNQ